YQETVVYGELVPYLEERHNLMSYFRKGHKNLLVIGNYQNEEQTIELPAACKKVLINNYPDLNLADNVITLHGYQAIVLELEK
ncbi:MAG: glucohydrolase, partial [Blautia coccoides]